MKTIIFSALLLSVWGLPAPSYRPMENPDLFQGDIAGIESMEDRNAIPHELLLWPEARVPYVIEPDVQSIKHIILNATKHIEAKTCIRFVERTDEEDFVKFFKGQGCYSSWGRRSGEQKLSLGSGCNNRLTIIHELMHAIGFAHEHVRSDRDDYVKINWDNIKPAFLYAFYKLKPEENLLLTPFDFDSIMLYGPSYFSKERGMITMESKTDKKVIDMYMKPGLSADDIKRINILYKCP